MALLISSVDAVTDLTAPAVSSAESPVEPSVEGRPIREVAAVRGAEDTAPVTGPATRSATPPGAGAAEVAVGAAPARAAGLPITVRKAAGTDAPGRVRVESLGADAVERLGGTAVGLRVTRADGGPRPARVRIGVDYSTFAAAFPAGAASRLGVIEMPACVLAARPDAACAKAAERARVVPSGDDAAARRVTVDVEAAPDGSPAAGKVYALTSLAAAGDPGEGTTNFAATDLKAAGSWQVGLSGGGFSYSYPIPLPPSVAGEAPELALSYSSSAVDGLTNYTNNQASVAGMGWEISPGFIERRFRPCADDAEETTKNTEQRDWKHQCWESPDENDGDPATTDHTTSHLTLSIEGKSSPIVKDRTSGGWKTVEDYGWKIDYQPSAATGQPYWTVTTTDGTLYRFGYNRDAMWQTAYVGDDPGEPCKDRYSKTGLPGLCDAPWRWNLDQRIDPDGNVADYTFDREENWYCKVVGALCQPGPFGDGREFRVPYDRGGHLAQVAYGRNVNVAGSAHTAKVVFNAVDRGRPPASGAPWDDDTPKDLDCPSSPRDVITACDTPGPAFYISKRLDTVVTSVLNASGGWDEVYRLEAGYKWVYTQILQSLPPAGPVLWLDTLRPVGLAGTGPDIPMPPVDFEATLLDNRADHDDAQGRPRLRMPRISSVYNGLGGRTDVTYGQANPCPVPSGYPTTGWDTGARDCYQATLGTYYDDGGMRHTSRAVYMKWLVTQVVDKDLVGGSPDVPIRYEYLGAPAWARAFDYARADTTPGVLCSPPSTGSCKTLVEDWDQFRGYQTVRTVKGAGSGPDDFTVNTSTFYRGMYDDVRADGVRKGARITDFDGNARDDLRALAGRTLQEQSWRATTVNGAAPERATPGTAAGPRPGDAETARPGPGKAGTAALGCTYPAWQQFASYTKGAKVSWTGHHWEALGPSVSAEPGKVSGAWKDLGDCAAGPTPTPTPTGGPTTPPGGPGLGGYTEIGSTRYEYTTRQAGDGPGIYDPLLITTTRQVAREAVTSGFRYTDQRTTYDAYGLPTKVNDYGDTTDPGDDSCTSTTYARDTARWLLDYQATVERRAGEDCAGGALLARTVTLYDGAAGPAANTPSRGNATETRVYTGDDDYAATRSGYDGYGRVTSSVDAAGKTTRFAFSPATGWPAGGVVTTNPLGHTTTTWLSPYHGQPVQTRDPDGNDTVMDHDALGRATALWTPQQPRSGGTAAASITYTVPFDGALGQPTAAVRTTLRRLRSGSGATATWLTAHTYIDGLGRVRENQSASPAGGRIVTVTAYDARGLAAAASEPAHNTADPGSGLLNPALTSLPQWSKTVHDGAERATAEIEYSFGGELRRTTTAHYGDRYDVQPPAGGKSVHWTDADDRVVKIEEWTDATSHKDTSYVYDRDGRLTTMTDANGNVRRFAYDLAGRRTASHDPDAGDVEQHYDAAGRVSWTKDGRGQKLSYGYDDLGRRTALWAGDEGTGTRLASWTYDTLAKGKPVSSTRYVGGAAYTDRITGYDTMGRPTGSTLTIPASEDLLAGDYTFTTAYDAAGEITEMGMPAAGGLPKEKVTFTSTDLGLPKGVASDYGGGFTYVKDTRYTPTSQLAERSYGATGAIRRAVAWDASTGWISRVTTTAKADTSTPVLAQDDRYSYDVAGRITRLQDAASAVAGAPQGQSECFAYDGLRRLSAAWTTTASSCAGGVAGADGLGADPYRQQYAYDPVGNLTTLNDNGQVSTYRYPAPGASAVRPNAVTSVERPGGSDTYAYDGAGQLVSRSVAGKPAAFQWNELGQMAKATVGGQDTSMVYDADGERLIRRDPSGKVTLYAGDMEIELAGGRLTAKRYYTTPDGALVAVRTGGSELKWLTSGAHGSMQLAIDDATGRVDRERYLPYGARRGADDLPFTDRGFLGKIEDDQTGLDYLSARYYDPALAKFVSTDPLLDLTRPGWANPYAYAGGDPVGLSDPTGLRPAPLPPSGPCDKPNSLACAKYKADLAKGKVKDWEKRLLDALMALGKIAADELGITAGIECLTTGDLGACGETALNILGSLAGGLVAKLGVKYALPWKWKKGVRLAESVWKHARQAIDSFKGWVRSKDELKAAEGVVGKIIKSCSSFVPGTEVLMADGTRKDIEDVRAGDEVLATDPQTGVTAAKRVIAVVTSAGTKNLVRVTLAVPGSRGATDVVATGTHPFWVAGEGHWLNASDLRPGMTLRDADGSAVTVLGVVKYQVAGQRVHNLTVEDVHTYHVAAGTADVLVHNAGACSLAQAGEVLADRWGKNRVTVQSGDVRYAVDLRGRSHFDKKTGTYIDTPHVKIYRYHRGPNGRGGWQAEDTRAATWADLRMVRKYFEKLGK
ncbi:polymorphic toxin-type HINT domain-containing protein [Sphaerisporangium krabiense]|uniref:RHS repeat-associated protein n=1 Tax=Sphaerisporangium krabiense TaxID=763782 RepID=A0A7W8Z886_9ACTN|nr:polymorphic toxin-type HINT domain-containing protein [Sphaerisporangium krabiense]MBB5629253.1 RHS repeat-associated protein [Sphaerisporangium krabiense]